MKTSQELWETIERLRLLPTSEVERVKTRWFRADREGVDDASNFARWLIANDYLTKYDLEEIRHGRADRLKIGTYQILKLYEAGPNQGSYLALDALGRKVLLDLVEEKLAKEPDVVRAFEAAAERVMGVQNPHVTRVIDFGKSGERLYLVRELNDGVTLAEVLEKRDRMQPKNAARLFSQAFAALQALHEKQAQGGELSPEYILLASLGKRGRIVKLLRPGMPAALFRGSASVEDVVRALRPVSRPENDVFLLGQSFYHSLTGRISEAVLAGGHSTRPVRELAPDVPELLAELAEQLVFPDVSARPRAASRVAKTLRVYLASEEGNQETPAEEEIGTPTEPALPALPTETEEEPVEPSFGKETQAPANRFMEFWEEFGPKQRDWLFFAAGAAGMLLLLLLTVLISGIKFSHFVFLLMGGAISFLVERVVQHRRPVNELEVE